LTIKDYYKEFEYEEYKQSGDIIKINNIKCFQHMEDKFDFYCINYEKDLCKNCIEEHSNHNIIAFNIYIRNQLIEKIKKSIDIDDNNENSHNIQKYINNNGNFNENNNIILNQDNLTIKEMDLQSRKALIKLLDKLKTFYSFYPCYNIDRSIISISKFCSNINKYIIKSGPFKVLDVITDRKIRFPWEFNRVPEDENIISIHLIEQGLRKIKNLTKYNLNKLEILSLKNNNITDISPLKDINFPNLNIMCLEENKITDNNYKVGIFTTLKRFKKLTKFFIGNNKIDTFDDQIYDCSQITEIGLPVGILSEKTIEKLSNFKFDNYYKYEKK